MPLREIYISSLHLANYKPIVIISHTQYSDPKPIPKTAVQMGPPYSTRSKPLASETPSQPSTAPAINPQGSDVSHPVGYSVLNPKPQEEIQQELEERGPDTTQGAGESSEMAENVELSHDTVRFSRVCAPLRTLRSSDGIMQNLKTK